MTHGASQYGWVLDPTYGLASAACVTLVYGTPVEEVLAGFGVEPSTEPQPLADLRVGPRPCVAVAVVGGGVAAVEPNGFQGSRPEVLRRVSGHGSAASVFCNVNLASRFSYAEAGDMVVAYDSFGPAERWGSDPHRFGEPAVARDDDVPTPEVLPEALALASHATGVVLTPRDLEGITEGHVLTPLLDDPRPAPPDLKMRHSLRWKDPDLVDAIAALPAQRQRAVAAEAVRTALRATGLLDQAEFRRAPELVQAGEPLPPEAAQLARRLVAEASRAGDTAVSRLALAAYAAGVGEAPGTGAEVQQAKRRAAAAKAVAAGVNPDPLAAALDAVDATRWAFPARGASLADPIRDLR